MSTGQADARDVAAETPLTPEAKTHLKAAARDVDDGAFTVKAVLHTVRRAIHPDVVGEGVELDEDEAYDLARTLEGACAALQDRVVRGVFARAAGDRPHGRRNGGPYVTLDREEIDALALELARIGEAACMADFKYTEDQLRTGMRAAGQKVDELTDRLYAKVGVTVDDSLLRPLHEKASRWRDDLLDEPRANRGTKSDDSPANASGNRAGTVEGDTVEIPRELAERLVRQVGLLRAADCTLVDMSPRGFVDMEVARRTVREYAARLVDTLGDLEERLGYSDGDALTDRLNEEEEVMEDQKRAELAEELEGGTS